MSASDQSGHPVPDPEAVTAVLGGVVDPELGLDIVELGMVRRVDCEPDGTVAVTIALTTPGCPLRSQIERDARARLESLPGVREVRLRWEVLDADAKAAAMDRARRHAAENPPDTSVPPTARVLMIASGKGGVGKSSVSTNLAAGLADRGFAVGVMDADIWGFSVPRMLGVDGELTAREGRIVPVTRSIGEGRVDVVSMGYLVEGEDTALMWRGLMLNRAVQHFCQDVRWADDLDYLVIDMPPGTGDVQMGLARLLPRAEMIVVTTPALAAQKVAARVVDMGRRSHLRIIGVIENMSAYVDDTGRRHEVFGSGGGRALAEEVGVPLLAEIPLSRAVAVGGDEGTPVVLTDDPAGDAVRRLVADLATIHAPPVEMTGCTARLLAAAEAAVDAAGL
ncbi:MAG: MRP family ATP-binding protein [Actinomyces sp.]|nr:MAG: MRP family ATP-binding protein [Actinomyces sp.]